MASSILNILQKVATFFLPLEFFFMFSIRFPSVLLLLPPMTLFFPTLKKNRARNNNWEEIEDLFLCLFFNLHHLILLRIFCLEVSILNGIFLNQDAMRPKFGRYLKSYTWPRMVVQKWLKGEDFEFQTECTSKGSDIEAQKIRKSFSSKNESVFISRDISAEWFLKSSETKPSSSPPQNLRMFVGTWNVGGRAPDADLNLRDLLTSSSPADIYVLGFQEIVPLNAGNVLGVEDLGPAGQWLSLIRKALNPAKHADATGLDPISSEKIGEEFRLLGSRDGFRLVASKQMVGIFLCVWVRASLLRHVSSVRVSCVGRGIMGYMGNKGSVSISMTLRGTTFCFVCTHLASGEKDGDEIRRNTDVMEILKKTKFNKSHSCFSDSPQTILEHDKIVWLGDLNYRLEADSWDEMLGLLQEEDWKALLEKDQLKGEQRGGRVLAGWEEGNINFPPTYKYLANSDCYAIRMAKSGGKRRVPAWCDRILWRGKGIKQQCYLRGESRFSDHRPVYALFAVDLDGDYAVPRPSVGSSSAAWGKVQAEELLLMTRAHSCIQTVTRF